MTTPFFGYAGVVWQAVYSGLQYYQGQLANAAASASGAAPLQASNLVELSQTMFTTLVNGAEAINTNSLYGAWKSELSNLQAIQALPLTIDPTSTTYFNARVSAYVGAVAALSGLAPQPPYGAATNIASGIALIPSPGLLEYYSTFNYETAPSGLTADNLITSALTAQASFQNVANAISTYQGVNVTQLYDVAVRQSLTAGVVAQTLQALTAGGFASGVTTLNTWNQIVALPAMIMCGDILNGVPLTQELQQNAVIRNTMLVTATKIAIYLLTQRRPLISQVQLVTLRVGESLMDLSARTLGDFSRWTEIAVLNGLSPPYVGATSSAGIAGWGTKLILPTPGTANAAIGTPPDYATNFLGVDLYVGPINSTMPPWQGDFETIKGYFNLAWALGRRIQTTIGTLLYHGSYGSRIPPQVGDVLLKFTAQHIAIQGKSAILSDPRVARVPRATARLLGTNAIAFEASVQPAGANGNAVTVNEVLSTLP